MDNASLKPILINADTSTFWIKPIGFPGEEPNLNTVYTQTKLTVEFARRPDDIRVGDIFIVYLIGISKIAYVAECLSLPREVTIQEKVIHPWKERWCWPIDLWNLTPEYGRQWANHGLKPFGLAKEYNRIYPEDHQNLGSLQFGSDKLAVSPDFGSFILRNITRLSNRSSLF